MAWAQQRHHPFGGARRRPLAGGIAVEAENRLRHQLHWKNGESQQTWQDDNERNHHLESGTDNWSHFCATNVFCRQNPLHHQKIRGPVPHGQDSTKPKYNARPMNSHRVRAKVIQARPQMNVLRREVMSNL